MQKLGTPADLLTAVNVVVGEVIGTRPHPDAERIRIADVLYSADGKQLQIVFGGVLEIVKIGELVAVAPPSKACRVEGKKMRRRKYRGIYSYGELCSLYELGLSAADTDQVAILNKHEGISIGTPIADLLADMHAYEELWTVFQKPISRSLTVKR
jgi:phenylalanyl-tRNA synthetase beta chain